MRTLNASELVFVVGGQSAGSTSGSSSGTSGGVPLPSGEQRAQDSMSLGAGLAGLAGASTGNLASAAGGMFGIGQYLSTPTGQYTMHSVGDAQLQHSNGQLGIANAIGDAVKDGSRWLANQLGRIASASQQEDED